VLLDGAQRYVERAVAAGVDAKLDVWMGMPHGFVNRVRNLHAPAISAAGELSGWYLSYVYDPVRDRSNLVIIDATDFQGKPVASVQLPQRVPYGFHGNWIAG